MQPTARSFKILGVVATLLMGGTAWAASPIPQNNYVVNGGTITTGALPAGYVVVPGTLVTDNGFLEREIQNTNTAALYIQSIVTDPGVTGCASTSSAVCTPLASAAGVPFTAGRGSLDFTDEDFVQEGNRTGGISSLLTIDDSDFINPTTEDRFTYVTDMEYGIAPLGSTPQMSSEETVATLDYTSPSSPVETFNSTANIAGDFDDNQFGTNVNINITQFVKLGPTPLSPDAQGFAYEQLSGINQETTQPGLSLNCAANDPGDPDCSSSGTATWSNGQQITALWIGQQQNLSAPGYFDGGTFGYTQYAQINNGESNDTINSQTSLTSLTNSNPVAWNSSAIPLGFGPAPSISAIDAASVSVTPTAVVAAPAAPSGTGASTIETSNDTNPATPIPYNDWTVSSGDITANCPALDNCNIDTIVNGGGILERVVEVGGIQYIQTIVTDASASGTPGLAPFTTAVNPVNASLGFYEESFVKEEGSSNAADQGIASNMHIEAQGTAYLTEASNTPGSGLGAGQFIYDVTQNIGWANGATSLYSNAPTMNLSQRVYVPDSIDQSASSLDEQFHMIQANQGNNPNGPSNGEIINMSSAVGTNYTPADLLAITSVYGAHPTPTQVTSFDSACTTLDGTLSGSGASSVCTISPGSGFVEPVMFDTSIISGVYQNTTNTAALLNAGYNCGNEGSNCYPAYSGGNITPNGGNGNGTILPWSTGQTIQATWIGANYSSPPDPLGPQDVDMTAYTNLSTGQRIQDTSQQYPNPEQTPNPDAVSNPNAWGAGGPFGVPPGQPGPPPVYQSPYAAPANTAYDPNSPPFP